MVKSDKVGHSLERKSIYKYAVGQSVGAVLIWATIWPLVYIILPRLYGKEAISFLNDVSPYLYYTGFAVTLVCALHILRPVFRYILNCFISTFTPYGLIGTGGSNISINPSKGDLYKSLVGSYIPLVKYVIIAYLALITFDIGLESIIRDSKVYEQQVQINNLKNEVNKLKQLK